MTLALLIYCYPGRAFRPRRIKTIISHTEVRFCDAKPLQQVRRAGLTPLQDSDSIGIRFRRFNLFRFNPAGYRMDLQITTFLFLSVTLTVCLSAVPQYSVLWGKTGETWSTGSRLPDSSFADYPFGEDRLPLVSAVTDVRKFRAKGDGKTDDIQAFVKAVENSEAGATVIRPGRHRLTDMIWITKPYVVLRGDRPDKTVLLCTPLSSNDGCVLRVRLVPQGEDQGAGVVHPGCVVSGWD